MTKISTYIKRILLVLFGILFLLCTIYIVLITETEGLNTPYPYKLVNPLPKEEIDQASNCHILILGDRMGVALNHYLPYINKQLSKKLKTPLKIYNWSRENESIIRSLHKLKSLKQIPLVVIYHGSSDEFYEKKFNIDDYHNILQNIKRYNNPKVYTLLTFLPQLSRLLFTKTQIIHLKTIEHDTRVYSDLEIQHLAELNYSLFKFHLDELIKTVKTYDSDLLLLTTPLNLMIKPRQVCSNTTTEALDQHLEKIDKYLKDGMFKIAYKQLKQLSIEALSNAKVYYLLGKAAYRMAKKTESLKALNLATAYDCKKWRSDAVFNSIIKQAAISNKLKLIDFNFHVNSKFEREVLFDDLFRPQPIFYEEISDKLINEIKQILKI